MSLSNRAAFAHTIGADLFVSLHMNASEASYPKGTEVYYSTNNNSANNAGLTSKILAGKFLTSIVQTFGSDNRGVKTAAYTVVHKNTVPAILIELGFISNKEDHAKMLDETYQENIAKTIYETLLQVFNEYPTGR
jgi:N-acetylmuramoyl-L-alanine amidase